MEDEHKRNVAIMVLCLAVGVLLGGVVSHSYAAMVLEDRAEDGLMLSVRGSLYRIESVDRGGMVDYWNCTNQTVFRQMPPP